MRHRKSGRQLNRNSSHRQAMFRNMAGSLVRHEIIKTTLPKAKELRRVVEPLITLAKTDSVANRRLAFARTRDNEIVAKLFNELGPRFASRAGGYTLIFEGGKNYVVAVATDHRLSIKEIDVYKQLSKECYVRSGLSEGDRVLNQNVLLVYNALNAD